MVEEADNPSTFSFRIAYMGECKTSYFGLTPTNDNLMSFGGKNRIAGQVEGLSDSESDDTPGENSCKHTSDLCVLQKSGNYRKSAARY